MFHRAQGAGFALLVLVRMHDGVSELLGGTSVYSHFLPIQIAFAFHPRLLFDEHNFDTCPPQWHVVFLHYALHSVVLHYAPNETIVL
jgi:hypothetical protein